MVFKGQYDWEWGGLEGALSNGFNHFLQNDAKNKEKFLSAEPKSSQSDGKTSSNKTSAAEKHVQSDGLVGNTLKLIQLIQHGSNEGNQSWMLKCPSEDIELK